MNSQPIPASPERMGDRRFSKFAFLSSPWPFIALFALLGLIGILNHAMWRDEFNTWLIVRDSQSLLEMLGRVKYQGHTALWSLSISFLRNFSDAPVIMQLFHWAIAVLSIIVFWLYSPFTHRQKVLFTFGYIPFYQYLLIARPYVLGMLFLFIFCAIFPARRKTYLPAAIVLALMANSSAYSLFIAAALLAMLGLEFMFSQEQRSRYLSQARGYDLVLSLLIVAASFGFAAYILIPPVDSTNHGGLDAVRLTLDPRRVLITLGRVFGGYTLIVPHNKKWLDLIVCGIVVIFVVSIFLLKLVRKPFVFAFFSLAYLELLAFANFYFEGDGPRHFANFYLVLIAAFWLFHDFPESDALTKRLSLPPNLLKIGQRLSRPLFMAILVFQFLGGLYGLPRDLLIPFSAARETAQFIQTSGWQDEFIVASRDANMAAISGYLDRKLYYPELQEMGSFTLYREDRQSVTHRDILRQSKRLLNQGKAGERILLILHKPLDKEVKGLTIEPIREFTRTWTDTERYYLYWLTLNS